MCSFRRSREEEVRQWGSLYRQPVCIWGTSGGPCSICALFVRLLCPHPGRLCTRIWLASSGIWTLSPETRSRYFHVFQDCQSARESFPVLIFVTVKTLYVVRQWVAYESCQEMVVLVFTGCVPHFESGHHG